jgi:hypothetical protein
MSLFAHHAGPALAARDFEFAHARYVAMPALLWLAAICVVVIVTAVQVVPSRLASYAPVSADPGQCFSHGA